MSDLSAAAAALGLPEAIVQRSAAARAAETGMTVDEILAAWAGGASVRAPTPAATETAAAEPSGPPTPASQPPAADETAEPGPAVPPAQELQHPPPAVVARSPIPDEVGPAQAASLPEVITVPTAGIRERMNLAIPRWMAAVILIIPLFALVALGGSSTGECGEATQLQTDVVTGDIVNCDGSEFTGSGVGGGGTDFVAQGEALYAAAPGNCAGCHGVSGGGGVGPAFGGVVTTFGACTDHIEWVRLGSQGFRDAGESGYGDSNKPIGGGMPGFGNALSDEQLASVVAFERVRFGGADPAQVLTDCGLASAEGGEGSEGGDGESPADGEVTSTTVTGGSTTTGGG